MKCCDCSEAIGFDLCGACFDKGLHKRAAAAGRFNQYVLSRCRSSDLRLYRRTVAAVSPHCLLFAIYFYLGVSRPHYVIHRQTLPDRDHRVYACAEHTSRTIVWRKWRRS